MEGPVITARSAGAEAAPTDIQPWPRPASAWYAVAIFAVVLAFLQLDQNTISLLQQPIKQDLHLSDVSFSLLLGPAIAVFYALVGVPLSRLVDTKRRNVILSIAIAVWSLMTVLCGLSQRFWQLALCRIGIGAGGAINGPGVYSMIADFFPREKLNRAISVLQIGFVAGSSLALVAGGLIIGALEHAPTLHWGGLTLHPWQLVFVVIGAPGLLMALLMRGTVQEPPRRGAAMQARSSAIPFSQVLRFLGANWKVYLPMMLGLAVGGIEQAGTLQWRPAFFQRTYGWSPAEIGVISGFITLPMSLLGIGLGAWLNERLVRKYNDAHLRTVVIGLVIALPFQVLGPLMPSPWLAIVFGGLALMATLMGAAPQNAALQSITPGVMRGQVTALYLFVFTVIGQGMGPPFIAAISDVVLKNENMIRYAMAGSAAVMSPLGLIIIWLGLRPYGLSIEALKRQERGASAS
jgi:MFS family permease